MSLNSLHLLQLILYHLFDYYLYNLLKIFKICAGYAGYKASQFLYRQLFLTQICINTNLWLLDFLYRWPNS